MSAKIMGQVWDLVLSPAERSVLLAMADHADHDGNNVRPSVALIAWKTDYSERQVQRIIGDLKKAGLLIIMHGATPTTPNHYRINIEAGIKKEAFVPAQRGRHFVTPMGSQDVTPNRGDIAMSQRGDIAMSPDPSWNHHDLSLPKGKDSERAKRVSPSPSEKKETTPLVVIQALADICVLDRRMITKKDHIILAQAANVLYQDGKRMAHADEEIATVISGFPKWFKVFDFRGQKGEAPTPDLVRRLWPQYAQWRKKNSSNGAGPPIASKPNIAPDALSREELAEAIRKHRHAPSRTPSE